MDHANEKQEELADKWKGMNDREKAPYVAKAEKDKVRFKREEDLYKATIEAVNKSKAGVQKVSKAKKKGKKGKDGSGSDEEDE
jgi:hypothetical protein